MLVEYFERTDFYEFAENENLKFSEENAFPAHHADLDINCSITFKDGQFLDHPSLEILFINKSGSNFRPHSF